MAKGGGAWKVAYADFVTAMMAFFLVMWICAQDQKIKQAIARYFVTPMGVVETGASRKPNHTGALFPAPHSGSVPNDEVVSMGRGRVGHTLPGDIASQATRVVSDWLQSREMHEYWKQEALLAGDLARLSEEGQADAGAAEEAATRSLSRKLRDQISRQVRSEPSDLSQELLSQALAEVNWKELAEDLLVNEVDFPRTPPRTGLRDDVK